MYSREILKIGERSLVELYIKLPYGNKKVIKYIVCSNYNESKCLWDNGVYFDNDCEKKEWNLIKAMNYILGNENKNMSYDRLLDLTKNLINVTDIDIILEQKLTESEANVLGIELPKKYDIVDVEFKQVCTCKKRLIVPVDTKEDDLLSYYDYNYYLTSHDFCANEKIEIISYEPIYNSVNKDIYSVDNMVDWE